MPQQSTQFYETTILTDVSQHTVAVTFGVVPARSLSEQQRAQLDSVDALARVVGGDVSNAIALPNAWSLTAAIALMLDPALAPRPAEDDELQALWAALGADAESGTQFQRFAEPNWWSAPRAVTPTPPAVAESLLLNSDIPFESSPLAAQSIAAVITAGADAVHVLAVIADVTAPWLLIAVPAGVILINATHQLGKQDRDGVRDTVGYRLLRWLAPELS
jgi:hypothetical protein